MKHTFFKCSSHACMRRDSSRCPICDGGLAYCTVCKGAEGSLTTDCCGRPLTAIEEAEICRLGGVDFIGGQWVSPASMQAT